MKNKFLIGILTLVFSVIGFPFSAYAGADKPDPALEAAAKKGDVEKMVKLAQWYHGRIGGNRSNSKAAEKWYKKAIKEGSIYAKGYYADLLISEGKVEDALKTIDGVTDPTIATAFFKKGMSNNLKTSKDQGYLLCAAKMGDPNAMFLASNMSLRGMLYGNSLLYYVSQSHEMLKRASDVSIPALIWTAQYGEKYKMPNIENYRKRVDALTAKDVPLEDLDFTVDFKGYELLPRMAKIKAKDRNLKDYIELMEYIEDRGKHGPAVFNVDTVLIIMGREAPLSPDTVLLDQLKELIRHNPEVMERILIKEFNEVPTRKIEAAKGLCSTKADSEILGQVVQTLAQAGEKGDDESYLMMFNCLVNNRMLDKYGDYVWSAVNKGNTKLEDEIIRIFKDYKNGNNYSVSRWIGDNGSKTSGKIAGEYGLKTAESASYGYWADRPARYGIAQAWLERAAKMGYPQYMEEAYHVSLGAIKPGHSNSPSRGSKTKATKSKGTNLKSNPGNTSGSRKRSTGGFQESGLKR